MKGERNEGNESPHKKGARKSLIRILQPLQRFVGSFTRRVAASVALPRRPYPRLLSLAIMTATVEVAGVELSKKPRVPKYMGAEYVYGDGPAEGGALGCCLAFFAVIVFILSLCLLGSINWYGSEAHTRAAPRPLWMASLRNTLTNRRCLSGGAHSKPAL